MDAQTKEGAQAELTELYKVMRGVHARLTALAQADPSHGYATTGSALDKMVYKANVLTGDCYRMGRDYWRGSQSVGGSR
jgi:hypothetical protein